ncbi:hypothetical protein ANCDUO_07271 [Ancylostoma duodenale]|uniref:Uncharacterized protein n=1 Tax=Ancylostoma duodenale TaxID=51022 RepID=A0A0C2GZA8_9BILA|nr:hypothetical protein ANCDUO_07271 [Ancylostoma duodenale]
MRQNETQTENGKEIAIIVSTFEPNKHHEHHEHHHEVLKQGHTITGDLQRALDSFEQSTAPETAGIRDKIAQSHFAARKCSSTCDKSRQENA